MTRNWAAIKASEKHGSAGTFDGIGGSLPALLYARALGSAAAKRGFDWDDPRSTLDKVAEELGEVTEAFDDPAAVREELGDLLFAVVNVARHRSVDPEVALREAAAKFRDRVTALEQLAAERGIDTAECGLAALDELWDEVKRTAN